ncbi:MAG TPA: 4a-hydroxytetrahydrobiopterin dehydratase [Planctomycetota bacterium]|nr:4a-hydroxytetrahydrobiopterin dehydratase [Planctomycetota bacterium]
MPSREPALADQRARPPQRGDAPLTRAERAPLVRQVRAWTISRQRELRREFKFPDFAKALAFVNAIGRLAERQGHHPDLELGWGRVAVSLSTHAIGGLSQADFVLAAKIDRLHARRRPGARRKARR